MILIGQVVTIDNDRMRWKAVCKRNAAFDDSFVFAVRTTGVYCRPSCPSRRAKRENVIFFAANRMAEAAGFRPCKRCRPGETSTAQRNVDIVETACRRLETAEIEPSLNDLATEAGFSRFYFHPVFREIVGMTPKQFARGARADRLRKVVQSAPSVTDAAFASGHESMHRFYDDALVAFGMAPRTFRSGAAGEMIIFAAADTSLGIATAAFTRNGVCAVRITANRKEGEGDLRRLFPAALMIPGKGDFERLVMRVVAAIEEPARAVGLPLDIRGTAFQQRVWNALRKIPIGTTSTYFRDRRSNRCAFIPTGRRPGLRRQPDRRSCAMPPGPAGRWRARRLPLGRRAQAGTARA